VLLLAVAVALVGIALVGYAGSLRSKNMSEEERRKAIKDFALKKRFAYRLVVRSYECLFQLRIECGYTNQRGLNSVRC